MKVALLNTYLSARNKTAAGTRFEELFSDLPAAGCKVTLLAASDLDLRNWKNIEIHQIPEWFGKNRILEYIYLSFYFLVFRYDLVISDFNPSPLTMLFSRHVWAEIFHIEEASISRRGRFNEFLMINYLKLYRSAANVFGSGRYKIITISNSSKRIFEKLGIARADQIEYIHCGVSENILSGLIAKALNPFEYEFQLIYVGSFCKRKNVEMILRALSRIDISLNVLFVGADLGARNRLEAFSRRLAPRHRIVWRKDLTDAEMVSAYSSSAIFTSASLCEGFGIPLVEAACMGLPIVCSNLAVFEEVVPVAVKCPVNDPEQMAFEIKRVLRDFASFKAESLGLVKQYRKRFGWHIQRDLMEQLIAEQGKVGVRHPYGI